MSAWTLHDPVTLETWVMPINPDTMTSPYPAKTLTHAVGIRRSLDQIRTFMGTPRLPEWQWSGVIRTEAHYDALLYWAKKDGFVHVTDHLGRTWQVVIRKYTPTDRKPMANVPWRMRYEMSVFNLGEI